MKNKTKGAPYAQPTWLRKAFEVFGRINVPKIDSKTIKTYNITSLGNESKVISTLRFIGVLNEDNTINPPIYRILHYSGDKKKEELSKIVRSSYKELFETIPNLEEVGYDILKNYFISKYEYSGMLADSASKTFIFLCQEAGIPLSKEITKIIETTPRKILKKAKRKEKEEFIEDKQTKTLKNFESSDYDKIIFLTKDSIKHEFPINSYEDWEDAKDLIEKKINRIFNNQGPRIPEKEDPSLYDEPDKN